MFVLKYLDPGMAISDNTALRDTFTALVDAVLVAARQESIESWERTVSTTLYFATNVVDMYLENFENQPIFLEIAKTVTEILRITFDKAWEMSATRSKKMDLDNDVRDYAEHDAIDSDSTNDDVITNDVIHEDVVSVLDKSCELRSRDKTVQNYREAFARIAKMVFEHDVFRNLFCHQMDKDSLGLNYVSKIMSDCIAELLRHFHEEILREKNCKFLEPYVLRISQAVKEDAFSGENVGKYHIELN